MNKRIRIKRDTKRTLFNHLKPNEHSQNLRRVAIATILERPKICRFGYNNIS